MKRVLSLVFISILAVTTPISLSGQEMEGRQPAIHKSDLLSLAGEWRFRLDPESEGVAEQWFLGSLEERVILPGTTDENKKGIYKDEKRDDRLSRVWYWVGAAWYQRRVTVPETWRDRRITLFLERTKDVNVWVDEMHCGHGSSLSAPHTYDLTEALRPGEHTLTILVDNSKLPPIGPAHAVDERTQTNWNGIVGKIELRATEKLYVEEIQVYPDVENDQALVHVCIGNQTRWGGSADLILRARRLDTDDPGEYRTMIWPVLLDEGLNRHEIRYRFDKDYPLWDEFNPVLMEMAVTVQTQPGADWLSDTRAVKFGMRSFSSDARGFKINGKGTFLRGSHDCAIYPLTGYAPMSKAEWLRLFGIAKSYGINHYRFHTWCPPPAAFAAADEIGMYLQPELPSKTDYGKAEHDDWLRREGEMIFKAYGNHPSFVMFTLGNELGRNQAFYDMVAHFKRIDSRRLYAQGSNNQNDPGQDLSLAEGDDFWVTAKTGENLPVRGSYFQGSYDKGHIENLPPSTLVDFDNSIAGLPVPVVGHEIGSFQVYPDYREISEYAGVLKARNYEMFRDRLREAKMLDLADDFVKASGVLAAICYRECIEASLRTRWFGGFQLLDLHDFSGQGTAPVGILNVFMESKGLIEPEDWRAFCSEVVPLLKMKKYTWTNSEAFIGAIEISNFGPSDFPDGTVAWKVSDSKGKTVKSGRSDSKRIPQGDLTEMDLFSFSLTDIAVPQKLTLELSLEGTHFANRYAIWVYESSVDNTFPEDLVVTSSLDDKTVGELEGGGKVLFIPEKDTLTNAVKGAFQTDFWCFPMFRSSALKRNLEVAPGTLGLLCDPDHPALAEFPTSFHSDWQWWRLVKNSNPVILDETSADFRPIVQVIDNFWRNHKLGILFEAKVGQGKLLVCSIDLMNNRDHPEVRQFLHSLIKYAGSSEFSPDDELGIDWIKSALMGH